MERGFFLFQADRWEEAALRTGARKLLWSSGDYPNDEQWVRADLGKSQLEEIEILASFSAHENLDRQIVRLLLLAEAAGRGARQTRLFLPYMPYSLQDRDPGNGSAVGARVFLQSLVAVGIKEVFSLDLHSQKFLPITGLRVENGNPRPAMISKIRETLGTDSLAVVVPDAGALPRGEEIARGLGVPIFIFEKQRIGPGEVKVTGMLPECRAERILIVDDMINTGGTLAEASALIREQCRVKVSVCVSHLLLAGNAAEKLARAQIEHIFTLDSYGWDEKAVQSAGLSPHVLSAGQFLTR